jgi:hypothetical protein
MRLIALLLASLLGCGPRDSSDPVELRDLVLRDSTYHEPVTLEPYTGPVSSAFLTDFDKMQIEGEMLDGVWHGMLRVYHRDGRIRYEGRLEQGVQCGPWTENTDPEPPTSIYEELVTEIESLALYPLCSEER